MFRSVAFPLVPLASSVVIGLGLGLAACGGTDIEGSGFEKAGTGKNDTFETGKGTPSENGLGDSKPATSDDLAACATSSAVAEQRPVYLVFMYDKSGSMANDGKWSSAKAATRAFFESPDSKGLYASLTYFPENDSCSTSKYTTPKVGVTALPSTLFGQSLDGQGPGGGTPTRPALEGAISYAQSVAAGQGKDGKVAIVLVTDGEPAGCDKNDVKDVQNLAATVSSTIPTYVIGVGDSLAKLDDIAAGGGTGSALIVSTSNPAQIQADFAKAIEKIKGEALSCDYTMPPPPSGAAFDKSKVNVQYTPEGGTPSTLGYNQDCTGGTGWKYDDPNNPTTVSLCAASCDATKGKGGKVDIVFGCATQTGVK
ncbi:hypothetical protein AKJ09_09087 [Labilithrix luteola]|uniref:VWFA domain-containing protein n=1 Tax=Labilithrix luteola TaxID=1391654 RepID=A0A0K1Q9L2_9BACT|nr:vWA domain-containing protein [Labilithrix luteola]AKV02424.1 hypothetical protein AKJ09_09087 [Labilithrix luteola]